MLARSSFQAEEAGSLDVEAWPQGWLERPFGKEAVTVGAYDGDDLMMGQDRLEGITCGFPGSLP